MTTWKAALAEQKRANEESWKQKDSFVSHRAHLTALIMGTSPRGRLCILGAGNCADLDLESVVAAYDEVHLVDIDRAALERAFGTLPARLANKLRLLPEVDLSGLQLRLERWSRMEVTPDELMTYPQETVEMLKRKLAFPFDRVLSSCVLSQLHLLVRRVLTETHPLAEAVAHCLNLAHLRTLVELTREDGQALLVSDLTSNEITRLSDEDCVRPLEHLQRLTENGDVFHSVNPHLLSAIISDDPVLKLRVASLEPTSAWLWKNGAVRRFLVYAAPLTRLMTPVYPASSVQ